jgi:TPR repeat protein
MSNNNKTLSVEDLNKLRESIDEANTAYNFSRWKEAFNLYSALEKQIETYGEYAGSGHVYYRLGFMHNRGHYVKKSAQIANQYFKKCLSILEKDVEQNDPEALCDLAFMYNVGDGVAVDKEKAFQYYQRAADTGYYRGLYNLGFMYSAGSGVKADKAKAAYYYQIAAQQGHTWAQNNLGLLYDQGEGVKKDKEMAVYWYTRAAEQKHASALNNLGLMYEKGEGVKKDYAMAFQYYQTAMENGNLGAQYNIARFYEKGGDNLKQDLLIAINLFFQAAIKGQKESILHIQDILSGKVPIRAQNPIERDNYQLLGLFQLAECWPDSHQFLSVSLKESIFELFAIFPPRYRILPELVTLVVRKIIVMWPKEKIFSWQ